MEIKTKVKKWGNSIAVILPRSLVEAKKIHENDEIVIEVRKRHLGTEFFGKFPRKSGKTAQEIKENIRKGW